MPLYFFICIRNFSTMDNEVQRKTPLPVVLMLGFSIMFCLLINAKILHYKKKGPINETESQKLGKIKQFEKEMLINKILFLSVLMPLVVALIILLNITQKIHLTGKEFPHDVIYWILHSLPPIAISLVWCVLFAKRKTMIKILTREVKGLLPQLQSTYNS